MSTPFENARKVISTCKRKTRIRFKDTGTLGWFYGYVYSGCETSCVVTVNGKICLPYCHWIEKVKRKKEGER